MMTSSAERGGSPMYLTDSAISPSLYQLEVRPVAVGVEDTSRLRTVHGQADAAHVARVVGYKEQRRAGHLFGCGHAWGGAVRQDAARVLLAVVVGPEAAPDHRSVYRPRTQCVHPDLPVGVGQGERLRQAHHGVLDGRVQRIPGTPDQAADRKSVV